MVIIDEAHRLKNRNCKLLEELKTLNMVRRGHRGWRVASSVPRHSGRGGTGGEHGLLFRLRFSGVHTSIYMYLQHKHITCIYYNSLSYSYGLAPLKMYRELQRDMGPYRTVRIALYMFTYVSQVNVFLVCSDETHANFTLLYICQVLL